MKFRSLSPQRQNYPTRASWFPPNFAPNSAKEHSQESGVTKSFPAPSASCSRVSPSCYRRHSGGGEVTDPALTYQIRNNPLAMSFSLQSPALHCSICPRVSTARYRQYSPIEAFPHTAWFSRSFSSIWKCGTVIVFLYNADAILFPLFFPSFSALLSLIPSIIFKWFSLLSGV